MLFRSDLRAGKSRIERAGFAAIAAVQCCDAGIRRSALPARGKGGAKRESDDGEAFHWVGAEVSMDSQRVRFLSMILVTQPLM